jgi:hypothetical protein
MLAPEEAAVVVLIRERDAEIEELRKAVELRGASNERPGVAGAVKPRGLS